MNIEKLSYMTIVEDTREQAPLDFSDFPFVRVVKKTLHSGDYSVEGYENEFAIERKSLSDLIGTITKGHERFERELKRLESYRYAAVVVESPFIDVRLGKYRSQLDPKAAVAMIRAFEVRYKIPFHFAGTRYAAATMIYELCYYFKREMLKAIPPMPRAMSPLSQKSQDLTSVKRLKEGHLPSTKPTK